MSTITILKKFEKLPEQYKIEVNALIEDLLKKANIAEPVNKKSRGGLGISKGLYNMSNDFDEPLEDFKEYSE